MLEQTVELNAKPTVATRQLNVAKRAKMARKARSAQLQSIPGKHTVASTGGARRNTIIGVFMNRYATNMYIRADCGGATLIRPDMLLVVPTSSTLDGC
jgi:hypothetical protein